jgi:hypothetical protein
MFFFFKNVMDKPFIKKIKSKREFSQLRDIDIEKNFELFSKKQIDDEEKISLTKEQLRKLFTAFLSKKLLSLKDKSPDWVLRKHISTRERLPYYSKIYQKLFQRINSQEDLIIFDLGAGINGFSYNFFPKNKKIEYIGFESVGQLVDLTNYFFKKNNINGKYFHLSLFELEKIKKIIKEKKGKKIVFLFKVIDALESVELNYSKKLILELMLLVNEIVLSFSNKSLGGKNKFKADRKWILNFIKENFSILEEFEFGEERYINFKSND